MPNPRIARRSSVRCPTSGGCLPREGHCRGRTSLSRGAPRARSRAFARGRTRRRARGLPSARLDPVRSAGGCRSHPRPRPARARRGIRPRLVRPPLRAARDLRGVQQGTLVRPDERLPVVPRHLEPARRARDRREPRGGRARARAGPCRRAVVLNRLRARTGGDDRLVRPADEHRSCRARGVLGHRRARPRAARRQPTLLRPPRAAPTGRRARAQHPARAAAQAQAPFALPRTRAPRRRGWWRRLQRHRPRQAGSEGAGESGQNGTAGAAHRRRRARTRRGRAGARETVRAQGGSRSAGGAAGAAALRCIPAPVRSSRLGPGPPRIAVRVRLRVGALHPAGQTTLGLVRAADALPRPSRRPDRAADRPRRRPIQVLDLWWEEGFAPRRAEGFVDAMRDALRAYLRFGGATRLEWAPHLTTERRLFLTRP